MLLCNLTTPLSLSNSKPTFESTLMRSFGDSISMSASAWMREGSSFFVSDVSTMELMFRAMVLMATFPLNRVLATLSTLELTSSSVSRFVLPSRDLIDAVLVFNTKLDLRFFERLSQAAIEARSMLIELAERIPQSPPSRLRSPVTLISPPPIPTPASKLTTPASMLRLEATLAGNPENPTVQEPKMEESSLILTLIVFIPVVASAIKAIPQLLTSRTLEKSRES
mmetsp:Transcript_5309/g.6455  ORF Transcript_5309/g.6455 Transcript_5309/m.6455 type:complete len:225 (-) Transcript_5309:693-1367(-)